MYFLNDKHEKYEYVLYCKWGGGCPYLKNHCSNLQQVFIITEGIARRHNQYHQPFYFDNDFYINDIPFFENSVYYKWLRRPVADLEEFTLND